MKILLTGGGTAGHARPVVLVAKSLQKNKRNQILYVGSRQGIEKKLAQDENIPFKAILSGKKRTYFSVSNYWDYIKILLGIIQSFFILIFFRPNVIFAKGGYVTVPIIFWLKIFRIPLVIHESDVVMGRANFWALKYARKACLGFPLEYYTQKLPIEKLVYTSIPVDPEFSQTAISSDERPKILITGGSQGSSKINDIISQILPSLIDRFEVWHLSGYRDFEKLNNFKNNYYHLHDFTLQMPKIMRDADLVIARAGASTLMEIAACSKPSIIIPLESAANNHQQANAQVFSKANAAVTVSEKNITANSLITIINNLMEDQQMRSLLGHHARSFYRQDATEEIINTIFEVAKK